MKTSCTNSDDKGDIGVFRTPDLYQSAFLLTKGIPLIGTERAEGRTFFLFRDEGKVKEFVEQYFSNETVPVLSFKGSLRELKVLVHGGFGRR